MGLTERFTAHLSMLGLSAERVLVAEGLLSEIRAGMPTRVISVPPQSENALLTLLRKVRRDLDKIITDLEATA